MGHKGIREGGPPKKPDFGPDDVVGLPVKRALIELAHEGYDAEIIPTQGDGHARAALWLSSRVRLLVRDSLVTSVTIG